MADVKKFSFGGTTVNLKDEVARDKIGSGSLQTTAQNLIGAVNEINEKTSFFSVVNGALCVTYNS